MDIKAYFDRIGFRGEARPDVATLRTLHRAHLQAIPYENLDVQFGRTVTIDPEAAFDKIVTRRRGGWCYEMNGLFGAALMEIGFKVTRMAGAATREVTGDSTIGNHLVLLVELDGEPWIADVGFGDGSLEPFPLKPAAMTIGGYALRLEALDERWWRFHNHEFGGAKSFDFMVGPADPALLAEKCHWLQSAPESGFVQNAVAQRFRDDEILALRGRVLRRVRPGGKQERTLASADELVSVLAADFGLDLPEAAGLWPRIAARHEQVMAAAAEAAQA
ncbi:MAG TPA: arylamine N-acetyltransferase [Phenylobacterium sp.]|nr:arylamine N-acetyltransferase [Phenylobacterium sp.]